MSDMSYSNVFKNVMNEAGVYNDFLSTNRCHTVRTGGRALHPATVQKKWLTERNNYVLTYYYQG